MRDCRSPRHEAGFTLIEALIALIIMAFGLLALAGVQVQLSRNADVAKQRTEATRLAQEKLENYRTFTSLSSVTNGWGLVLTTAGSPETIAGTNASFTRQTTIAGASTDAMRPLNVSVSWTDRAGESHTVTLSSVISKTDPADSGRLGFPQTRTALGPGNVSSKVPRTAIRMSDSQSKLQLSAGNTLVFSNTTGVVTHSCTGTVGTAITDAAGCTAYSALILTGYVSGDSGTVSSTSPTGITISSVSGNTSAVICTYAQATVDSTAISGYYYYVCAIPVASGGSWSGTLRLIGVRTSGDYKVCRFFQTATTGTYSHSGVTGALINQNFYVEDSNNNNCPTITSEGGTLANGGSVETKLQQNCRSSNGNLATECPAS